MTVATVFAVLSGSAPVTALVPATRIEALRRTQLLTVPAITLTEVTRTPFPHLRGTSGLSRSLVQVDCYGNTYTEALSVAAAVRTALEGATHQFEEQIERNEPETNPELFLITQSWLVFT